MLKAAAAPEPALPNPRLVESVEETSPPEKEDKSDLSSNETNNPPSKPNPPPSVELDGEEGGPGPPPLSLVKPPAAKRMGGWARLKGQSAPKPPSPVPAPAPTPAPSTAPSTAPSPAPMPTPSPAHELPFSLATAPCPGGWDKLKDESSSTPETPAPTTQPAPGGWARLTTPAEGKLSAQESPSIEGGPSSAGAMPVPSKGRSPGKGEGGQVAPIDSVAESSELLSNLAQFKVSMCVGRGGTIKKRHTILLN